MRRRIRQPNRPTDYLLRGWRGMRERICDRAPGRWGGHSGGIERILLEGLVRFQLSGPSLRRALHNFGYLITSLPPILIPTRSATTTQAPARRTTTQAPASPQDVVAAVPAPRSVDPGTSSECCGVPASGR